MADLRSILQEIYETRGRLTPPDVVDVGRDPEHPLHHEFNWDDSSAGEAWRLHQAHELIRSIKVIRKDEAGQRYETRAFIAIRQPVRVNDSEEDDPEPQINGGYRYLPVETVARDELLIRQVLAEMERAWRSLRKKYQESQQFWAMIREDMEEAP